MSQQAQDTTEADKKAKEMADALAAARKDVEEAKAAAEKAKAEAVNAKSQADTIVEEAKAKVEAMVADAKKSSGDVAQKSVSRKTVEEAYDKGMNHMQLAEKFFGSTSDENLKKVSAIIDKKFEIDGGIDPEVVKTEAWA